jgi:RNA polymerase sigma factor (sigma-70 family)
MARAVLLGGLRAAGRVEVTKSPPERIGLAEGSWDDLLDFLDPIRREKQGLERDAEAEARYLEVTRKLVCYFAGRGCRDADDLAMTTVLRVAARCRTVDSSGFEDRTGYFYGVARNVLHEALRASEREEKTGDQLRIEFLRLSIPDPNAWKETEVVHRCLDECLAKLTSRARRLLMSYYDSEGGEKIEGHRMLAEEYGKSVNALRIEVHRVRKAVRQCVFTGLHVGAGGAERRDRPRGRLPAARN